MGISRSAALRDYRFIGVAFVALYVVFVATAGRPYYLAGLYAPLAAAGALGLQRRRETAPSWRCWLIWLGYGLSVALAVGVLILSVSIARSDVGDDMHAYLPTGQRQSWDEMWPRLHTLTVS